MPDAPVMEPVSEKTVTVVDIDTPLTEPKNTASRKHPDAMTVIEHLGELRQRLMACITTFLVATMLAFWQSPVIIRALEKLVPPHTQFVQLAPGEAFGASFRLSMLVALALVIPVLLYHTIRFISPGLHRHERKAVFPLAILAMGLFSAGVAFAYWVALPMMLTFLLDFGSDIAINTISIAQYLNFSTGFLFATGLVFQLPLVMLALGWMGLVTSGQLLGQWRWSIVVCLLLSAIITPSADPISQIALGAGLYGLYAFSIVLLKVCRR